MIRASLAKAGYSVAVHNDYKLDGNPMTFWLFTHPDGHWIKGEGVDDEHALAECFAASKVRAISTTPSEPSATAEPSEHDTKLYEAQDYIESCINGEGWLSDEKAALENVLAQLERVKPATAEPAMSEREAALGLGERAIAFLRKQQPYDTMRADSACIQKCDVCDAWQFPDNDDGWQERFKHKPTCLLYQPSKEGTPDETPSRETLSDMGVTGP